MRALMELTKKSFERLSSGGKRLVFLFTLGLIAVSALDGLALFVLAKILDSSVEIEASSTWNSIGGFLSIVIFLFVLRSVLAIFISWKATKAFAREETYIGSQNYTKLSELKWEAKQSLTQSDYFAVVDRGPTNLVQGVIVSVASLVAEVSAGVVLLLVVMIMQPVTAVSAAIYFGLIVVIQHRFLSIAVKNAGRQVNDRIHATLEFLSDSFANSKIMQVMPSKSFEKSLEFQRNLLAESRANLNFLSALPRYFMESVLALGFLTIAAVTYLFEGPEKVLPALVLFSAAGFRLLPTINRIQGLVLNLFGSAAQAEEAFRLEEAMPSGLNGDKSPSLLNDKKVKNDRIRNYAGTETDPILSLENVSYTYPGTSTEVLKCINLNFELGKQYAIVGPSGAGKTTLVDLILGLLEPTGGSVSWSENFESPVLSYVPQDSHLIKSSAIGNIALEWDDEFVNVDKANRAQVNARIDMQVWNKSVDSKASLNRGPERPKLSGGQRQRIGIARALYRDADVIVLDEATSALDANTEKSVIDTINELRGTATAIIVAHRLTTIQKVDLVIYVESGEIIGVGSFIELRENLRQFRLQVEQFLIKD